MYTSTACWQRLSTRQCTAWPLHPTRRRGLLWQRALLHSSHRNTNLGKNPEQSLANASGEDCVRKHWHVRTWQNVAEQNIVWTQRRAFAVESSITWHQHASAWINMHQHDPTLALLLIIINMNQQDRMYTSTACWKRLSTRQGTAWPLHPTPRRGLLRESALLTAVQTTQTHKTTNHHIINKMPHKNLANVANARPKGCLWQPNSKQNMKELDRTWQNII